MKKVFRNIEIICLFVLGFLFNMVYVCAENEKIDVTDIVIKDKSETIIVENPTISNGEINSEIKFNKVNDYVIFELTLKNNEMEKYKIESITDNNTNSNIEIEYDYNDDYISKDVPATLIIKMTYKEQLLNKDEVSLNDLAIKLNFEKDEVFNPKTVDNIKKYLIGLIILMLSIVLVVKKKIKVDRLFFMFFMISTIMFSVVIYAKENYEIMLKFTNIDIIGKYETYNITINAENGSEPIIQEVKYGQLISEPSIPEKNGYIFVEWQVNGKKYDFNEPVTSDMTIKAVYTIGNMPIYPDGTINNEYFGIVKDGNENDSENNTNGINNALECAYNNNISSVKLEKGIYYVKALTKDTSPFTTYYAIRGLSNISFDLNGSTLKIVENAYSNYAIILVNRNVNNFKVYNGYIKGEREEHKCSKEPTQLLDKNCSSTDEWGHGIFIASSKNVLIENMDISETIGDGVYIYNSSNINIMDNNIHYVRRNGISIISGQYISIKNNLIHDIIGTAPQSGIDVEKNKLEQTYSDIEIIGNKIYNTVSYSMEFLNKISNLTIANNELAKPFVAWSNGRTSLDVDDTYRFPTNATDDYLMNKYNIVINNNKVINENIDKEHGDYKITATLENVNTLNYIGYVALKNIILTKKGNKNALNNLSLKKESEPYYLSIVYNPVNPTYRILSYSVKEKNKVTGEYDEITMNEDNIFEGQFITFNTNSLGIKAKDVGEAIITVKAMDYGKEPSSSDDDVVHSFNLVVNVTN